MANLQELLLKQLLSGDALAGISQASGVATNDVSKILTSALPSLLTGANNQTASANTAASFAQALMDHSKKDTSNLTSFFGKVDKTDGAKIIGHLLGKTEADTAAEVATKAGVSKSAVSSVLAVAAPLVMSLLGKQANANGSNQNSILSTVGALLGGKDLGKIATAAIASAAISAIKKQASKK